jgi:predicted alpha/beta hydrolase family esterase
MATIFMTKRLILVHGYGGSPEENWFPWLKAEAEKLGLEVIAPAMPNTNTPQLAEWLPHLQAVIGMPDEKTYLIGHSLGGTIILRYLESLAPGQKIGGAILVAAFGGKIHFSELNNFTEAPWDDERIKQATDTLILINSDDDPHVPLSLAEDMRDRFDAPLIIMHNAGHISAKAGYFELPEVIQELKKVIT